MEFFNLYSENFDVDKIDKCKIMSIKVINAKIQPPIIFNKLNSVDFNKKSTK